MAIRKRSTIKQKKTWYQILAPKEFKNMVIGETFALEPNMLVGRTIKVNLMNLTNDNKNQSVELEFKIIEVKGLQANTIIRQYRLMPTYIKRIVRVGRSKLEDSFNAKTKDNINVIIKPLLTTPTIIQRKLAATLKKNTKKYLDDLFIKTDFDTVLLSLISGKLQFGLKNYIKKIYPIATCQIRIFKRVR